MKTPKPKPLKNAAAPVQDAPETKPPTVTQPPEKKRGLLPPVPAPAAEPPPAPVVPIGAARFPKAAIAAILSVLAPVMRRARKSTLPLMRHILIQSKDGLVTITATDLDTTAVHTIPAPTANSELARKVLAARFERENGEFLVPYEELRQIVKNATADDAIILQAYGGKGRQKNVEKTPHHVTASYLLNETVVTTEIPSLPVSGFPEFNPDTLDPFTAEISVGADTLRGIRHAMSVSSLDETRYVLQGVALDGSKAGHHTLIGTDGRRMFMQNSQSFPFTDVRILPACAITRPLIPMLNEPGWTFAFAKVKGKGKDDHGVIRIRSGAWEFFTRGIEGNYPNWRQVVPGGVEAEGASAGTFKASLHLPTASRDYILATAPKLPAAPTESIRLTTKSGALTISRGKNTVTVPNATATGEDMTIAFNMEFFLDALRQDFSELRLIDEISAGVFREGAAQLVLMPMRVSV